MNFPGVPSLVLARLQPGSARVEVAAGHRRSALSTTLLSSKDGLCLRGRRRGRIRLLQHPFVPHPLSHRWEVAELGWRGRVTANPGAGSGDPRPPSPSPGLSGSVLETCRRAGWLTSTFPRPWRVVPSATGSAGEKRRARGSSNETAKGPERGRGRLLAAGLDAAFYVSCDKPPTWPFSAATNNPRAWHRPLG